MKCHIWDKEKKKVVKHFAFSFFNFYPLEEPEGELVEALKAYDDANSYPIPGCSDYNLIDFANYYGILNYEVQWEIEENDNIKGFDGN